jgi:hypothetical protein
MEASFKENFKNLALNKKIVLFASSLTVIATLLPWYSDIDRFNIGDSFLGITGPLYLAGLIVFFASLSSFVVVMMQLLDRPMPKLPLAERKFYVFNSILSILMVVLAASVYFHPKFGINLIDKNVGIGMIIALVGSGGLLIGGVLKKRERSVLREDSAPQEDLLRGVDEIMTPVVNVEEREAAGVNRDMTVAEAMEAQKEEPTKAWNQVEESVDSMAMHNSGLPSDLHKENTNDIR